MHAFSKNTKTEPAETDSQDLSPDASRTEREKLRDLHGKKKLEYIWDYYKLPITLSVCAIALLIYFIYGRLHQKDDILYVTVANIELSTEQSNQLSDGFLEDFLGLDSSKYNVLMDTNLSLVDEENSIDSQAEYASQVKIVATAASGQQDVLLLNEYAFTSLSKNGYFVDLDEFLSSNDPELYEKVKTLFCESELVLEDNSDETILDPTLEYEAVTEKHPYGLLLSNTEIFDEASDSDDLYLAVSSNAAHPQTCLEYLRYLYGLDSAGYTPDES
jgi:hypothetical protein